MIDLLLPAFLAAFARAAAFVELAPLTGDRSMPRRIKVSLAVALAVVAAPVRPVMTYTDLFAAVPAEVMFGMTTGFIARMLLAAAEAGGQLMALNMGLGMGNTFDRSLGESASIVRRLAYTMAALAFLMAGGLESCIYAITVAPTPSGRSLLESIWLIIERSDRVLVLGLRIAAPIMVAGLVANVGVALASKAAPALNIFSVMLSILLMVGGVTLLSTSPAFVGELRALARNAIDTATGGYAVGVMP